MGTKLADVDQIENYFYPPMKGNRIVRGMILAVHAQQLKGLRTCGDKEGSALEEFMLKDEGCLVFGHLNSRGD